MKKVTVTLAYDEEKLSALRLYLEEKHQQVEDELTKSLDALYAKTVPQSVRHYLDLRGGGERSAAPPPKKPKPEAQPPSPRGEVKHDGE